MTTTLQNLKFPQNLIGYIEHWSKRPTVLLLSSSLLIMVIILTLAGGIFFWTYQLNPFLTSQHSSQSELEMARSIMQNMKRMVGNQGAWSKSIQEEYNNIFADQIIKIQAANYSSSENFVGSNYSINQVSIK